MATIIIPTYLTSLLGTGMVEISQSCTIAQAIEGLVEAYPQLSRYIYKPNGLHRRGLKFYVNEEMQFTSRFRTIGANDTLTFVPTIGGAGGKGNAFRNAILDHALGGPDYTRLGTVYIALFTAAPTSAGGGTEVSTSGGTSYVRYTVTNDGTSWSSTSSGTKNNLNLLDFGTAGANWGTVVAGAIMTASTAGSILYFGSLTSSKTINTGDGFRIPINGLVITES
jgi:hypothetical protein